MSKNRTFVVLGLAALLFTPVGEASSYLVKLKNVDDRLNIPFKTSTQVVSRKGHVIEVVVEDELSTDEQVLTSLRRAGNVIWAQKNHPIALFQNPSVVKNKKALLEKLAQDNPFDFDFGAPGEDNPEIEKPGKKGSGKDPDLDKAWGLKKSKAIQAWQSTSQGRGIIVAVTDTGVDYNHEDLIHNMWRNENEIDGDGKDNDNNGYVDDVVGYDFAYDDAKPFDMTTSLFEMILGGGNPGHGTHCAGVVGAVAQNGLGAAGVAPQVQIMALRFITEKGQGDTAGAIKAIDYAVDNGASIISASWGSMGEEEGDNALREAIERAREKGVLFVAAAGNGRVDQAAGKAVGYSNDDAKDRVYPASYPHDNIIAVSALDVEDKLGEFSNWGETTVDIGAPGVKVYSTVPGSRYQDTVIDLGEFMKATWDGTSMATPHVAGALAVMVANRPNADYASLKSSLLSSVTKIPALKGKVSSEGRLDLGALLNK